MKEMVSIKVDNRYADGNVLIRGNTVIGNKKTVEVHQLNGVLMIGSALSRALKKLGVI